MSSGDKVAIVLFVAGLTMTVLGWKTPGGGTSTPSSPTSPPALLDARSTPAARVLRAAVLEPLTSREWLMVVDSCRSIVLHKVSGYWGS